VWRAHFHEGLTLGALRGVVAAEEGVASAMPLHQSKLGEGSSRVDPEGKWKACGRTCSNSKPEMIALETGFYVARCQLLLPDFTCLLTNVPRYKREVFASGERDFQADNKRRELWYVRMQGRSSTTLVFVQECLAHPQ
jgi:hypothetical protein